MIPGPHTLFEIIDTGEVEQFRVTKIVFDIEASSKHTLTPPEDKPLDDETPDSCKEHNDAQVKLLLESKAEIEREIAQGYDGSKTLAQYDYIKNALKHFRNWYKNQELGFPDSV